MVIRILFFLLFLNWLPVFSQNRITYKNTDEIVEIKGSDYAVVQQRVNLKGLYHSENLVFINTKNNTKKHVYFEKGTVIYNIDHIKIDKLDINKIIVKAKTFKQRERKQGHKAPSQLYTFSIDGTNKKKITPNNFYTSEWNINTKTGVLLITGIVDIDNNGRYSKEDKHSMFLYNLVTEKVVIKK